MHLDRFRQYNGRLGSGKSATSQPVILRLRQGGIELDAGLNVLANGAVQHWKYATLRCAVPITAKSAEVLISSGDHPGATLFVADKDFTSSLALLAPQLRARAARMTGLKPSGSITAVIAALVAGIYVTGYSPAKTIAGFMPERARTALGVRVVTNMTKRFKTCTGTDGLRALDTMMQRLSDAAGLEKPFNVTVVNWRLVNAFAAPGGRLVLTRGLIRKAKSADMVAGVMAHEMGHGIELHPEAGLVRALGLSAAGEFFFTGSSSSLKNIGLLLTTLSFSRKAEAEADHHALEILRKAGISPKPLAAFFKQMAAKSTKSSIGKIMRKYPLLSSHPKSLERAKAMVQQATYAATPVMGKAEWQALRDICGKPRKAPTPDEIAGGHRRRIGLATRALARNPNDLEALGRRARAYVSLNKYLEAIADQGRIIALQPDKPDNYLARARMYRKTKEWDKEIADYSQAIRLRPKKGVYFNYRARAYDRQNKWAEAIADYDSSIALNGKDAFQYKARAKLHGKLRNWDAAIRDYGKAIELQPDFAIHYISRSKARRIKGDYAGAVMDLDAAIKLRPKSAPAFFARGRTFAKMQQHEDAIADFSKTVSLAPKHVIAFARRGLSFEAVGDRDAAIKDYRKALVLTAWGKTTRQAQTRARARLKALGVTPAVTKSKK